MIDLTLLWLAQAMAGSSPHSPEPAAAPPEKVICKRFTETGSLVIGYTTCKTKREWERERNNLRTLHSTDSCRFRGEGQSCS